MKASELALCVSGTLIGIDREVEVKQLLTDSRLLVDAAGSVFFAISGENHDGHAYISKLVKQGVSCFIVEKPLNGLPEMVIQIKVENPIKALQAIVARHRGKFHLPVVGITGSNGKTIVKEWLSVLTGPNFNVIKSPKSYNSQIGVPLSVWQINENHSLAIFETGISTCAEMGSLESIIKPTIGVFTNIGPAHDDGFKNTEEKIREKCRLFIDAQKVIYCKDHLKIGDELDKIEPLKKISWSYTDPSADFFYKPADGGFNLYFEDKDVLIPVVFELEIWKENALHAITTALVLGVNIDIICSHLPLLEALPMRLQVSKGKNGCYIIDDTYTNDLGGLKAALDFQKLQQQSGMRTLVLSQISGSTLPDEELGETIVDWLNSYQIQRFIGIGENLVKHAGLFPSSSIFFSGVDDFLTHLPTFHNEMILVKGSRQLDLSPLVKVLKEKHHRTRLEVNFESLVYNLNLYRKLLKSGTKIMAMIKAFGYGSGSLEIANLLQYHKIDYLGVAYPDEGIALRNNGVHIPIMVMNADPDDYSLMSQYRLDTEIYSLRGLKKIIQETGGELGIHLKIETGMNRLGFSADQIPELLSILQANPFLRIVGIFSHLAASESKEHDAYTEKQVEIFQNIYSEIVKTLGYRPIRHLLNTGAISRWPQYHFDMVRLGIGLYGIDTAGDLQLKHVSELKTVLSQIKHLKKGMSVGYGRRAIVQQDSKIGTIAIGYADGYSRSLGNGNGSVMINGHLCKTIGNICMDMTMVDISHIDAVEGDEVVVFGENPSISQLANWANTIPYEILTNVSQRVNRVFLSE